ncbi:MAG: hypothetical protein AABZ30_06740 [Myxococcota bacterium]
MLSEVPFGAWLVYSPRGASEVAARSRNLTYWIKQDKIPEGSTEPTSRQLARELRARIGGTGLDDFLNPEVALVPVPRSSLTKRGSLWPPARLCDALVAEGLGRVVVPCLDRTAPMRRSAGSPPGTRPSPLEHERSMQVTDRVTLADAPAITLVDDVVTKGSQLLSAASLVHDAFPRAVIRGFAFVRTLGLVTDIARVIEPCVGTIRLVGSGAVRTP